MKILVKLELLLLYYLQNTHQKCPKPCDCSSMSFIEGQVNIIVICNSRNLTELPSVLPYHTMTLDLDNNNVSYYFIFFI